MRSLISRAAVPAVLVPLVLVTGGCGNNQITTPTTPTTPTTVTETFSGTVTKNGAVTHTFTSGAAGTVQATLTALGPDASVPIGMSLGTWNGATCAIVLANDKAIQTSTVIGTVSSVGGLCLRLYDVGNLTEPASYEVLVTHP